MQTARITKDGKGWKVTSAAGTETFADATAAMERANAINEALETAEAAKASSPIRVSVTGKDDAGHGGKLTVYFGDARMGRYPAFALYRDQLDVLIANWPGVVEAFEANKTALGTVDAAIKASRERKAGSAAKA